MINTYVGEQEILSNWDILYPKIENYFNKVNPNHIDIQLYKTAMENDLIYNGMRKQLGLNLDCENKFIEMDDIVIPLYFMNTSDRGKICALSYDLMYPYWIQEQLSFLQEEKTILDKLGLAIIDNGFGEYIVELKYSCFGDHLKTLVSQKKSWKDDKTFKVCESKDLLNELSGFSNLSKMVLTNFLYFFCKENEGSNYSLNFEENVLQIRLNEKETTLNFENFKYLFDLYIKSSSHCVISYIQDVPVGIGFFMYHEKENIMYWMNSFVLRDDLTKKLGIGNCIVLRMIQYCYEELKECKGINFGLDIFEYKKTWHPIHVYKKGLEIKENGYLCQLL